MLGLLRKARVGRFPGGLQLEGHKLAGEAGRIRPAPLPSRIVLPLAQHIGAPAKPLVEVGQRVLRGQTVASATGYVSAAIHASTSGTVTAIGSFPVPHPSGLPGAAIVIEADGRDEVIAGPEWTPQPAYRELERDKLRQIVRQAGIVGLGGAAFPSAVKLNPGANVVDTLVLNGAECEPYISCDAALMAERAEEIVAGAELIRYAIQARDCIIGIEDNKPEGIAALSAAIQARGAKKIIVSMVPTRYPQGGEKQLIQSLTGREVPGEGLPLDIGIVVHNVGTAVAVWRAVTLAEPLISRVVTVTGAGLVQPANLEARIGTPVEELIAHCGGYSGEAGRLIMGGPMMGFELASDAVPMVKATNCILAAGAQEIAPTETAQPCIRCGECAEVCPASLLPQQLYWHSRAKEFDKAQALNLFDCIECGCCAQVCPSHIPLVQYYRFAKTGIYQAEQERRKSDIARGRHEFRQERLEREKREKEEIRRRKREAMKQKAQQLPTTSAAESAAPAQNDAVAAAIARAKAEKARRRGETPDIAEDLARSPDESASTNDPAAAAIARAKARRAGEVTDTAPTDDPVAAAIARAKARKATRSTASPGAEDPVADARAKKAAQAAENASPNGSAGADADPVAAAIAKARARKAAQATSDARPTGEPASSEPADAGAQSGEAETPDPVAAAIAKAKAARAAKRDPEA